MQCLCFQFIFNRDSSFLMQQKISDWIGFPVSSWFFVNENKRYAVCMHGFLVVSSKVLIPREKDGTHV